MHEDGVILGKRHDFGVHLIGPQQADPLGPDAVRLSHGYPDIRIQNIRAGCALGDILRQADGRAVFRGDLFAGFHKRGRREQLPGCARGKVDAHFCAGDHQRIAHIVAGISEIGEVQTL